MQYQRVADSAGLAAGELLAPLTGVGSELRHARLFHPRGVTLLARAFPVSASGPYHAAGARLAGGVLVRFSSGWWKRHEWPDVLGCALRFTKANPPSARPDAGDQDLLLATIRHPLTTVLAPLTTNVKDYLANDYFGVSPFRVDPLGEVTLRLVPERRPSMGHTRDARLLFAMLNRTVRMVLEARPRHHGASYEAVAIVELLEPFGLKDEVLRFDPFQTDRGFEPVGFVHHLRVAAYKASQLARNAF
jgi:hypothetical protein